MANNNIISFRIPDHSSVLMAKRSMEISLDMLVQAPTGYEYAFYYKGQDVEIPLKLDDNNKIIEIEDKTIKKMKKNDEKWFVDVVCYKTSSFSFVMPWGYKGNGWRTNGTITWSMDNVRENLGLLSNPTGWDNDGTIYCSTYSRKGVAVDGLGVRLREVVVKNVIKGIIDEAKESTTKDAIKKEINRISKDTLDEAVKSFGVKAVNTGNAGNISYISISTLERINEKVNGNIEG